MSRENHRPTPEPDAPPSPQELLVRLRDLYGSEASLDGGRTARWWVQGARSDSGIALWLDLTEGLDGLAGVSSPSVVWVTRPGEDKPERCPIISMVHLDAFLARVSIARRSPQPVYGNVCPGED